MVWIGFFWINGGYVYIDGLLVGYVLLVGVYGIVLIVVVLVGLLCVVVECCLYWLVGIVGVFVLVVGWLLYSVVWMQLVGKFIFVCFLQGNVL